MRASVLLNYIFKSTPSPPERQHRPSLPGPTEPKSRHSHKQHCNDAKHDMKRDVPQPSKLKAAQTNQLKPRVHPLHRGPPQPVDPPLLSRPTDPEEPVHPEHLPATPLIRHVRNHRRCPMLMNKISNPPAAVLC